MNAYWIVTSLICIGTGVFRSIAFITRIAPAAERLPPPILAWFYTAWFIVSGLFVFGGVVFFYIGLNPERLASNQIATLFVVLYAMAALTVVGINLVMFSYYSYQPLVLIGLILVFAILGIRKQKKSHIT